MKLRLLTDRKGLAEFVLAGDPVIAQANPGDLLMAYRYQEGDPSLLEVPDDATLVRMRALTKTQIRNAEVEAGRPSEVGRRVYLEGIQAAQAAFQAEVKAAALEGRVPRAGVFDMTFAQYADDLGAPEAMALRKFREWRQRRAREIMRAAVVAIVLDYDGDQEVQLRAGDAGFPVEVFEGAADASIQRGQIEAVRARSVAIAEASQALRVAMADVADEDRAAVVAAVDAGRVADVPEPVLAALRAGEDARAMGWLGAGSGIDLVDEIADHVERLSLLGKGGRTFSSTPSGEGTGTTNSRPGPACSA